MNITATRDYRLHDRTSRRALQGRGEPSYMRTVGPAHPMVASNEFAELLANQCRMSCGKKWRHYYSLAFIQADCRAKNGFDGTATQLAFWSVLEARRQTNIESFGRRLEHADYLCNDPSEGSATTHNPLRRTVSFECPTSERTKIADHVADMSGGPDAVEIADQVERIRRCARNIRTQGTGKIPCGTIIDKMLDPMCESQEDVARALNIHPSRVCQVIRQVAKFLQ